VRTLSNPQNEMRTSHARTPHQALNGTVTPNSLHFSINHSGIPDIDPAQHKLVIHGMVKQPLLFDLEALSRYPLTTRMSFVECSGNSGAMFSNEPIQATAGALHGLVSNAEWTGVPLSILLDEAGIDPKAKWLIAEGADSLALHRSVPVKKAYDDALIAIYQNGERLMPGNGYPMRLLLPGYQGNMNVKFLRRIKVVDQPSLGFYEARTYSQLLPDGKAYRFHFLQEVKSFITNPSFGQALKGPGHYEISGIAYSGTGRISRVMVSAARAGPRPRYKAQCSTRRHSPVSACRGAGMASRLYCKAAPGTKPATPSRCARISLPFAAKPSGRWRMRARSPISTTTA
jgi:sulfane dehydrogenase subunit SoxC